VTPHTTQVECNLCGEVYTIAIGYPARAPHGPNKDCRGYFKPYLPCQVIEQKNTKESDLA